MMDFSIHSSNFTPSLDGNESWFFCENCTYWDGPAVEDWVNIAVMVILVLVGIPANAIVIIVLIFSRTKGFSVTSMYIINMAVVDLLLLGLQGPSKISNLVAANTNEAVILIPFSPWLCKLATGITYINMTVSILTLMALSVSRYCAVMHPVGTRVDRSKGRTLLLLLGIWAVCLVYCAYPIAHVVQHPRLDMCVENWIKPVRRAIFSTSLTFFFYLLPLLVISICYAIMAKVLWNAGTEISRNRSGAARRQSRRKIARMVLILVVCFALCYLPYHVRVYFEILGGARNNTFFFYFSMIARAFAYLNSCLNPLLYSFLGENFRSQMKDVFFCFPRLPFKKEGPSITTALHEIDGSRRGNNNSADTQMTYAGHTKIMTSRPL